MHFEEQHLWSWKQSQYRSKCWGIPEDPKCHCLCSFLLDKSDAGFTGHGANCFSDTDSLTGHGGNASYDDDFLGKKASMGWAQLGWMKDGDAHFMGRDKRIRSQASPLLMYFRLWNTCSTGTTSNLCLWRENCVSEGSIRLRNLISDKPLTKV